MKKYILLLAMAIMGLTACHNQSDQIKAYIPGTYVKSVSGEFSMAKDTLVISLISGNSYSIVRHTTYRLLRDGKLLPPQHQVQNLAGTYDEQRQVLLETIKGRIFTFDPVKRILIVNAKGVYRKIN